jgi:hypothetical protein
MKKLRWMSLEIYPVSRERNKARTLSGLLELEEEQGGQVLYFREESLRMPFFLTAAN